MALLDKHEQRAAAFAASLLPPANPTMTPFGFIRQRRQRRGEAAFARCEPFYQYSNVPPSSPDDQRWVETLCAGVVVRVRQHARTGSKIYVRWAATGNTTAAWVPGHTIRNGERLVVRGRLGWGSHHNEWVFYVSGIDRIPRKVFLRAERHRRWLERNRWSA